MRTILSLLLLMPICSNAIVNTSSIHTSTPEKGLHGEVKLSINTKSGNTESERFTTAAKFTYQQKGSTDYLILKGDYGTTTGVKTSQSVLVHLRRILPWTQKIDLELFTQAENSPFNRLTYRALGGGGARYHFIEKTENVAVIAGAGAFYLQEEIDSTSTDSGVANLWRGNGYLVLEYQLNDFTTLSSTTYYQPNLENSADYRMLEDASILLTLSKSLAVEMSYQMSFDSQPPIGVKDQDQQIITTLNYRF